MIGFMVILGLLIVVALGFTFKLAVDSRNMSVELGVENGVLTTCPASPNCVSSAAAQDDSHYIAAISDQDGSKWASIVLRLSAMDGATLVTEDNAYVYFTFTTKIMRFVDDVEFYYQPAQGEIAVRSASRVGQSDMNANRDRIEAIRSIL